MGSNLLNQLRGLEHLAPDAVAARLRTGNWLHVAEMTQEQVDALMGVDCVLANYSEDYEEWNVIQRHGWAFWFDLEFCQSSWGGSFVIPEDEFNEEFPDVDCYREAVLRHNGGRNGRRVSG